MIKGSVPPELDDKLELKMTSMIDCVFLLLIFFIASLKIPRDEAMIETMIPQAKGTGQVTVEKPVEGPEFGDIVLRIVVDEAGNARKYLGDQWMIGPGQMLGMLESFRKLNEKGRVVIQCGDDVPYKDLIEAISVVQLANLKISFANLR